MEGFLDQPHLVILLDGFGRLLNHWGWLHLRLWQLNSLYFFNFDLLRFFFFLEYRLLDFDLIALIGGYLNLWGVDRRWKYFGLGFKNFRLSFDDLFDYHLGGYGVVPVFYFFVVNLPFHEFFEN